MYTPFNRNISFLLLLLCFSVVAACENEPENQNLAGTPESEELMQPNQGHQPTPSEHQSRLENGVQVVEITAGPEGYEPGRISLQAGMPVRLIFTRTTESECLEQVQIPAFGIQSTNLPLNQPVSIEFTPTESGEFTFVCGMDMQSGTLVIRS